jgi:PKD repeat protein
MNKVRPAAYCVLLVFAVTFTGVVLVRAQTTMIALDPANYVAHRIGENFTMNIVVMNVQDLGGWQAGISWNPNVISLVGHPKEGPFLKANGQTLFLYSPAVNGTIKEISSNLFSASGVNGSGVIATLVFNITKQTVDTPIILINSVLSGPTPAAGGSAMSIGHQVDNATVTLIVNNQTLVANAGSDQTVNQGAEVILNGSRTFSPDPNATNYTWTFTDGTLRTLRGVVVGYTFNVPGIYNVTLTAQDSEGNSSTDTTMVTVRDTTLPVPKITIAGYAPGQPIPAGKLVTFNGSGSTDVYSVILNYVWDMGDGSPSVNSETLPHAYSNPGDYPVSLTVGDAAGNNATTTATIYVVGSNVNASLNLPSYVLWVLAIITAFALGGSVFWLRRHSSMFSERREEVEPSAQ